MSGELLQQYHTLSEASKDNNLSCATVSKMLQQDMIKYPRNDFYFGYDPKPRWVIVCYDNETRLELGRYKTIKEASEKTGVSASQIQWQVQKDLPFNERVMGSTGLWFVREVIDV